MDGPEAMQQILFWLRRKNQDEITQWWSSPRDELNGLSPAVAWGSMNEGLVSLAKEDFSRDNPFG